MRSQNSSTFSWFLSKYRFLIMRLFFVFPKASSSQRERKKKHTYIYINPKLSSLFFILYNAFNKNSDALYDFAKL